MPCSYPKLSRSSILAVFAILVFANNTYALTISNTSEPQIISVYDYKSSDGVNSIGEGRGFYEPQGAALDHENGRWLFYELGPSYHYFSIRSVDIDSGDRSTVVGPLYDEEFNFVKNIGDGTFNKGGDYRINSVQFDIDKDVALLSGAIHPSSSRLGLVRGEGLFKTDLSTGITTQISGINSNNDDEILGDGPFLYSPANLLGIDKTKHRAIGLVFYRVSNDNRPPVLISIDLSTGDRFVISSSAPGHERGSGPELSSSNYRLLRGTVDEAGNRALLSGKRDDGWRAPYALISVDLETGDREIVSSPADTAQGYVPIGSGPDCGNFEDIKLVAPNLGLVSGGEAADFCLIDLETGNRTPIHAVSNDYYNDIYEWEYLPSLGALFAFKRLDQYESTGLVYLPLDLGLVQTSPELLEQLNAGEPGPVGCEGNPVNAMTGNKYQYERDMAPDSGGLKIVRHYNTRSPLAGQNGWIFGYGSRIRFGSSSVAGLVEMIRPDGRALAFYRTAEHELAEEQAQIPAGLPAVTTKQHPLHWTGSEWRYRNERGDLEYYNEIGRLQRIVDRQGLTQWVEYDADGRVARIHNDFGRSLTRVYNRDGRLVQVSDPDGKVYEYSYDSIGNLIEASYPDGTTRVYHYGEFGAGVDFLTGITDENGNRYATWKYDDQGRAILSEHAGGADRTEFEYLDDGRVRVTDAGGSTRTYTQETVRGRKLPSRIENGCSACGDASDWEYNDLGLVTREVDRNGNVTTYEYNEYGLETARTEAAGTPSARTITTVWDTDLRLPLEVTEPGLHTQYSYDSRGRRLSKTETDLVTGTSRTTAWSYHPDSPEGVPGQLAAIDGPRTDVDDVTTFAYDAQGNRIRTTNALGHVTEITDHDAWGRPQRLVDPNGLVTELDYDARGHLVSRDVGGEITTFAYDGVGNLVRIDLPDGSALQYEYDAAQRLVALTDDEGHRIDYTLDAAGNRVEQEVHDGSGSLVRAQQQVFDEFDRLIRTVGALGQTTEHTHDDNGNRIASTDPAGDFVQNAFDALDRLTQVTDPMGGLTTYDYDDQDRITAVTDPNGNTTHYSYNGFGDRTVVDSPDSGITTYEHDAAGNVIAKADAKGQRTEYTYDAGNRLLQADYADGAIVDYVWDEGENGIGRLARIDETTADGTSGEQTHSTEWQYDRHGRVLERSQTVDGLVLRTQHRYDSAGRRIETVYPSGKVVTYTHDRDELTGVAVDGETVISGADYQPFGPVNGWTWGDGDVHQRSYDLDGRLSGHSLAAGSPNGGFRNLDYTADDNIAVITGPNLSRTYGYDGLDRLVAANDPDRADTYAYDANGNRTQRIEAGQTETYTTETGSNRMLRISSNTGTTDYTHDANGNLIDDGDHRYTYSARNRLVQVDNGDTAQYRYNALGQRIHKQAGSNVDYAALAAEYQHLADDLAAEAAVLSEQAQTTLDLANEKADQAEHLNQEALALRQQADTHEQEATALREQAEQLRSEAQSLTEQAEQKEAEALPLQEQADIVFAEAAALREQADAEWQAAQQDQQRADDLAASAEARRAEAETLEAQADENDRIAAENRTRTPELEAEAQQLRIQADEKEAAAQPYLQQVERLQPRISALQRIVDRFSARIERLKTRLIDTPRNWREYWHNWRLQWRIRIQQWVRDWQQYRLDGWQLEQAESQQQADALMAEATALREQADDNDRLATQLREEADRLDAEAVQLRQQAEEQRALAEQEEVDSADHVQQAEAHRSTAENLDGQAQAKEDEAQPLADQAQALRTEAEALRQDADTKTAQAEADEQEADDLTQLAETKRADADEKEQQADTLNTEATALYDEAGVLQEQADTKQAEAAAVQQQADEYAALADNPPAASEEQYFVYNESGRLIGRYDESGNAIREYFRLGNTPVAVAANDDLYYIHGDQLSTPRLVSEPGRNIIWSWISDPFGDFEPNEDSDGNGEKFTLNLRFSGQYFDAETGANYNYFRHYDPTVGRYTTSDPIGLSGGMNPYAYAADNPVQSTDRYGLRSLTGFVLGGVCIAGSGVLAIDDVKQYSELLERTNKLKKRIDQLKMERDACTSSAEKIEIGIKIQNLKRKKALMEVQKAAPARKLAFIATLGSVVCGSIALFL